MQWLWLQGVRREYSWTEHLLTILKKPFLAALIGRTQPQLFRCYFELRSPLVGYNAALHIGHHESRTLISGFWLGLLGLNRVRVTPLFESNSIQGLIGLGRRIAWIDVVSLEVVCSIQLLDRTNMKET